MKRTFQALLMLFAATLFAACGGEEDGHEHGDGDEGQHHEDGDHDHDHDHDGHDDDGHEHDGDDDDDDEHGKSRSLGKADIGAYSVEVNLFGPVSAGHEAHADIKVSGASCAAVRAWIGVASGKGSMKAKVDGKDGAFHGHIDTPATLPEGSAMWVEVEDESGKRAKGSFAIPAEGSGHDEDHGHEHGHDHEHGGAVHHGVMAELASAGHVELKLHDDKGDLELWLTRDEAGKKPLDLPLDTVVRVTLSDKGRTVELRVRNRKQNEDENGNAQIRGGKTNYFIFPGDSGADAAWLQGKKFSSNAVVEVMVDGKKVTSGSFKLVPHVH